jgi:aminopeptidase N
VIRVLRAAVVAASIGTMLAATCAAADTPSPGAVGIGDRLNPTIGNGGYDVRHYDLDLTYATSDPSQALVGNETITAVATQSLSQFDLDFAGKVPSQVLVNGAGAAFKISNEELVIKPAAPIANGATFTVQITGFGSAPMQLSSKSTSSAFFKTPDGSVTAPQPFGAHLIYPCNDHPRDKATFAFTIDVPAGERAIANGDPVSQTTANGRTIWVYDMAQPMATELTQITVGNWDFDTPRRDGSVILRNVSAPSLTPSLGDAFAAEARQLDYMVSQAGAYPFNRWGILVEQPDPGFTLETQTIAQFPYVFFGSFGQAIWDPTMTHELSHQWFGNSVAPYSWSDIWLNEGHATWYEFTYAETQGELEGDTIDYPDPQGYPTIDEVMKADYAHGDEWRADFGPVAAPKNGTDAVLFSDNVYFGGAVTLYALRQKIGATAFQKVEKAWVQRYAGQSASTDDFIALATQVSGQDVTQFLRDWVYGTKEPPMPGHPDWTVNPVKQTKTTTTSAAVRLAHHGG